MQKATFNIPGQDGAWGSYISKYPPDSYKVTANAFTAGTVNVITDKTGQADKRQGGVLWNSTSQLSGPPLDQYEAVFQSGVRHFIVNDSGTIKASTGNGIFNTITAGFTNPANFEFVTYQNRVYGDNGVDSPITYDIGTSYGGVSYSFTTAKTKYMGCQVPSSHLTVGTPTSGGAVPAGSHRYVVTYLYYNEEESNGGSASSVVSITSNQTVPLTAIPIGGYGVTGRNIYRDNNDGNYLLLTTIADNTTTTFTDTLLIGSTPTPLPIFNDTPPLFSKCALFLDRIFIAGVAGSPNLLFWSNAGAPDLWNPNNWIQCQSDDVITAIVVCNGNLYIWGQHSFGVLQGNADNLFYYSNISTNVGCVDNRSVQIRSIVSVPTILWLSALPNKGIYYSNGSIAQYLSDFIEDLTFNLAQINYVTKQITQSSETDFLGGTYTPGIDLTDAPGLIETINPTQLYSTNSDWTSGTPNNLIINGDVISVPTQFAPTVGSGALSGGAIVSGSNITLNVINDFTGAGTLAYPPNSDPIVSVQFLNGNNLSCAVPFTVPHAGTLTSVSEIVYSGDFSPYGYALGNVATGYITIWNDTLGTPGSVIYAGPSHNAGGVGADDVNWTDGSLSVSLPAGQFWIGVTETGTAYWHKSNGSITVGIGLAGTTGSGVHAAYNTPGWVITSYTAVPAVQYSFVQAAISASGSWQSPIYNSNCQNVGTGQKLVLVGSYPTDTSSSVVVQGSVAFPYTWVTTDTLSNPNGNISLTGGNYQYWQIIATILQQQIIEVLPTIICSNS